MDKSQVEQILVEIRGLLREQHEQQKEQRQSFRIMAYALLDIRAILSPKRRQEGACPMRGEGQKEGE